MEALLHVELDLEPGVEPIRGWLTTTTGRRAFSGYLELLAALERLIVPPASDDLRKAAG